jgi:nitrate/TMAO reductase-like tetraheme cytochrome c subunit
MLIDEAAFKASAHGGEDFFCIDCHQDLDGKDVTEGHKPNLKPVDCITFCHDDPAEDYLQSTHVKLMRENNKDVLTCKDCHSGLSYHYTPMGEKSPRDVPKGTDPLHRKLTIDACGSCHQDYLNSYKNNAHGQVATLGHTTTDVPVCFDCHGKHKILNSSDPESKVGKERILETCGSCHANANASFVKHVEHPQIKNIKYYKTLLAAIKNARSDPGNLKTVIKSPQTILCIVFVMYVGILAFTFSAFGLHCLLSWFAVVRDEYRRKEHGDEEQH